jgi:hypothetical protein
VVESADPLAGRRSERLYPVSDTLRDAKALLETLPNYDKWAAEYWPGQGWTVVWKPNAPICHMRWTDGLRPEIEARIEAEAKFIAASLSSLRALVAEVERLQAAVEDQEDLWSATRRAEQAEAERDRLQAALGAAEQALTHLEYCGTCAEDSWNTCENGGRQAQETLTLIRVLVSRQPEDA